MIIIIYIGFYIKMVYIFVCYNRIVLWVERLGNDKYFKEYFLMENYLFFIKYCFFY